MLIDLLSTSNYVSYNIKVAELLGLHQAIYLSELMNINDKAIRKEKLNKSAFNLDREYIVSRTTLSVEEQLDIDNHLIKLGILEKPSEDSIILNLNVLTTLMMSADEELITNVKKLVKIKDKSKKRTKAEAIRDTTNPELIEAYSEWIDAVYDKEGWMSAKAVKIGQETVDRFSNHNLDVALDLLAVAALHGHRDISWSIPKYKEQYMIKRNTKPPVNSSSTGLSSEVF